MNISNASHGPWRSWHNLTLDFPDGSTSVADAFPYPTRLFIAVLCGLSGATSLVLHITLLLTVAVTHLLQRHVFHAMTSVFAVEVVVSAVVLPLEVVNLLASPALSPSLCHTLAFMRLFTVTVLVTSYALLAVFLMADFCHPNWLFLAGRRITKVAVLLMVWLVALAVMSPAHSWSARFSASLVSCEFPDPTLEFFTVLLLHLPSCVAVFVCYFLTRSFNDKFYGHALEFRLDCALQARHDSDVAIFHTLLIILSQFVFCGALFDVIRFLVLFLNGSSRAFSLVGFVFYSLRTAMAAITTFVVNVDLRLAVVTLISGSKVRVRDLHDLDGYCPK